MLLVGIRTQREYIDNVGTKRNRHRAIFQQIELMMVNSALSDSFFFVGDREQQSRLIGDASKIKLQHGAPALWFPLFLGLDNLHLRREGEGEYTADRCVNPS